MAGQTGARPAPLGRRLRAGLLDFGIALAWAAVVIGSYLGLQAAGVPVRLPPLLLNLVAHALIVVPVVLWLAFVEGGRYEASPGKQRAGLRVRRLDGRQLGRPLALLRNLVKVGLPAALGHAAVLMLITGQTSPDVVVLQAVALSLPLSYLLLVCFGEGRGPWDLLCGTQVVPMSAGRRFAAE
ncbi:MAG: RDD family protein [Propionibacteriaceae bacterium]|nr:RDD family protein [Propionibacteriaceae bacterium]